MGGRAFNRVARGAAQRLTLLFICSTVWLISGCANASVGAAENDVAAASAAPGHITAGRPLAADRSHASPPQAPTVRRPDSPEPRTATFDIHHALTVNEIPSGAKSVRIWFWLPSDDECQKVLDFTVADAPPGFQMTQADGNGNRYLYAQVTDPSGPVSIQTDFLIRRCAFSATIDPTRAGPLTDVHRKLFAEYLRRDVPHMQVTDDLQKLADEVCGGERNVVKQARMLGQWVVEHSDHYSLPDAPESSGHGDARYCLAEKGGGCTDQHALFTALARARGIPTRLHFGSLLKPQNEGKGIDPGYRCWVQYFVPRYGWVPMDLSAADTTPDRPDFYFAGLDERRIRFSEGRDLILNPAQQGPRLNLMISAYVEVDGRPHKAFDRVLRYAEVRKTESAPSPAPLQARVQTPVPAAAGRG